MNRQKILVVLLMICFLQGPHTLYSGIHFGPVEAVKEKVKEYEEKEKKAIQQGIIAPLSDMGTDEEATGTVFGTIRSVLGDPIRSCKVYLDSKEENPVYSKTDGSYELERVSKGEHTLIVVRPQSDQELTKDIFVAGGETIQSDFNFDWLVLESSLRGSVYDNIEYKLAASQSPYIVQDDFSVSGNYLHIEPGVEVRFSGNYYFSIHSDSIIVDGSKIAPVLFTSGRTNPLPDDYSFISFGGEYCDVNYVICEYGSKQFLKGNADSRFRNCTFRDTNSLGADVQTEGIVEHCNFEKSTYIALYISKNAPRISYCNIAGQIEGQTAAGQYSITYCNMTRGKEPIVRNRCNWTINAQNNWWGTTNSSTIAGYVEAYAGTVLYQPFLSSEVSNAGPE
ncbi:MAG: hypothetical protein GF384_03180 [Elusimicrobia bacterium]|nr:hypothetical protein [Elusimicrobiota bacterium]